MPIEGSAPPHDDDAGLLRIAKGSFPTHTAQKIAVAVSGGSDSMASLHLMTQAVAGRAVQAVTVDHALRPESADEARAVGRVCADWSVSHHVLRWDHGVISGNVMDAARRARYGLMADWAAAQGVSHIVLGHTADDQAETFLMELARQAGIDGLAGMQRQWSQNGVQFLRPFLGVSRAALRAYLTRHGVGWIDDPSNDNDRYARVKARQALAVLQPLGITLETLGTVMTNLSATRRAILAATHEAAARVCHEAAGEVIFDLPEWQKMEQEVQRRLLIAALRWISGAGYVPRGSAVARAMVAIEQGRDVTLAGCRLRCSTARFRVVREPNAVTGLVALPNTLWDGRWQVDGPFEPGLELRPLGAAGLRQCKVWKDFGYSRDSLLVSPAVWYGKVLVAAPVAGFEAGFDARIVTPFTDFVLSH